MDKKEKEINWSVVNARIAKLEKDVTTLESKVKNHVCLVRAYALIHDIPTDKEVG